MISLVLIHFLPLVQQAASLPVNTTGAVSVPGLIPHAVVSTDERSIFHILWSCAATLFACAWVAVHPDLPGLDDGQLDHFFHRFKLMLWVLICPEAILIWAWRQNRGAEALRYRFNRHPQKPKGEHGTKWNKIHGHFLQMGGFILHNNDGTQLGLMGEAQFNELLAEERIEFPDLHEDDINDRSKSDGLSKFIAVGQALWFIIQCFARTAAGLPITLIELATIAFASLSVLMYILWWNKPQNVQSHVAVRLTSPFTNTSPSNAPSESNGFFVTIFKFFKSGVDTFEDTLGTTRRSQSMADNAERVPRFYAYQIDDEPDSISTKPVVLGALLGSTFGIVHLIGWAFAFPSVVEKIIWRASSVAIVVIPLLTVANIFAARKYLHKKDTNQKGIEQTWGIKLLKVVFAFIAVVLVVGYIVARIALMVVMCTALRFLSPKQLMDIQWVSTIPHI